MYKYRSYLTIDTYIEKKNNRCMYKYRSYLTIDTYIEKKNPDACKNTAVI